MGGETTENILLTMRSIEISTIIGILRCVLDYLLIIKLYALRTYLQRLCNAWKQTCPDWPIEIVTIIREPIERILSSWRFWPQEINRYFSGAGDKKRKLIEPILMKFNVRPPDVTPEDAYELLSFLKAFRYKAGLFPKYAVQPYEMVLSMQDGFPFRSTDQTLATAKRNMENFTAIGVMESMPSFFVLLTEAFHHREISETCEMHHDHPDILQKYKVKGRAAEKLHQDVVDVFMREMKNEYAIYEHAKFLHSRQLQRFGFSVESAAAKWQQICGRKSN